MSLKKRAGIWVVALSIICVLVVWHVVYWHSTGMYLEMFKWLQSGRGYIAALYNLGLMVMVGLLLGWLMEKIASLVNSGADGPSHSDEAKE